MGGLGDEFDKQVGPEVFGTSGGLSCSNISNSLKILEDCNEWPSGSARFFMRDHQIHGDGLRGLVFNSVMESKVYNDFSSLTEEDMFFHLHIASIHYGLPTTRSIDLVNLMLHDNSKHKQIIQSEKKELSDIYHKSKISSAWKTWNYKRPRGHNINITRNKGLCLVRTAILL